MHMRAPSLGVGRPNKLADRACAAGNKNWFTYMACKLQLKDQQQAETES